MNVTGALQNFIFNDAQLNDVSERVACGLTSCSSTPRGILLQAQMGGGKTSILLAILEALRSHQTCQYLECASLNVSDRGKTESMLLQTGGTSTVIYLLVDNIDYLPSTSTFPSQINVLTTSSPSFTSALRLAIDKGNLFVIATCTDVQAVDPSFIHNYRLGKAIELKLPTKQDREVIIRKFLLGSSIGLHNDVTASTFPTDTPQSDSFSKTFFTMVARELALRTQGCSACDVLKFLREQYQLAIIQSYCVCLPQQQLQSQSQLRTSNDETVMDETSYVKLSVNQLLQASTQLSPAALMSSAKGAVHNFVRQIDFDAAEPVLVGVDDVKQQLLRCISTIIPEVITSEKSNFRPSLRKCSGIVLHGPSGAGKTALTDWLAYATRRHCKFLSVPCADLVHKVVGETERKLADIFETARELSPCIVLLDNIDMLLGASAQDTSSSSLQHQKDVGKGRRTGERHRSARTRHHAVDRMLSTLLVEIDGIYTSTSSITAGKPSVLTDKPSVLVVVTTTAMNCLDRALIRPGRLEEHIALALPTTKQRVQLLVSLFPPESPTLLNTSTSSSTSSSGGSVEDWHQECSAYNSRVLAFAEECARYTSGRSYAHIKALYQEANIAFARETLFVKIREGLANLIITSSESTEKVDFICKYMIDHTKLF